MEKTIGLPSYFVIDSVCFKDLRLNYFDILLYSLICGLANNEKNYCFASNKYLAEILDCSTRNIQLGLKKLKDLEYLQIEVFNYRTRIIKTKFNLENESRVESLQSKLKRNNIKYREKVPSWINQKFEVQEASEEEIEKMKNMIDKVIK